MKREYNVIRDGYGSVTSISERRTVLSRSADKQARQSIQMFGQTQEVEFLWVS